jgi:putative aldouronate transport system permease protein
LNIGKSLDQFYRRAGHYRRLGYDQLLIMLIPGIIYYIVFHYFPIYGIIISFKDFNFVKGIWGSDWAGLKHFNFLFNSASFISVFKNTLILGLLKLIIGFPMPIIFALLLNEIRYSKLKKLVQTTSYLPHFLSWVILGGMFFTVFSVNGPINAVIKLVTGDHISFLTDPSWFRALLVSTDVWKSVGWGSIIYLAAMSGISTEIYEAAMIDGANRYQKMMKITIPSLAPVITIMLILSAGQIIKDDFDQIFNLYNPAVYKTADVISTYVYRQGLEQLNYSYAAAADLFKNVIALLLVYLTNLLSKKINDYGIW